jgi:hypothetical protein
MAGKVPSSVHHEAENLLSGSSGTYPTTKPECGQDAYSLGDEQQYGTFQWYIGDGSYPAALSYDGFVTVAKRAMSNIADTNTNCAGIPDKVDFTATFMGFTTVESDFVIVGGDSKCDSRDGVSTLDAANLDGNGNPPLAAECDWHSTRAERDDIIESDVRFNIANYDFTTTPASGCSGKYDVEGVLTHEFGHTVGLGHVSEASYPWMTMSTTEGFCDSSQRTLGKGDIHALDLLYCNPSIWNCQRVD